MELDSEINLTETKIMTYLHFYEMDSLQSQYNLFDTCFAKTNFINDYYISNAIFLCTFYFLVTISSSIWTRILHVLFCLKQKID